MSSKQHPTRGRSAAHRRAETLQKQLKQAELVAKGARDEAKRTKAELKRARKSYKAARKAAKETRKQVKSQRREYEKLILIIAERTKKAAARRVAPPRRNAQPAAPAGTGPHPVPVAVPKAPGESVAGAEKVKPAANAPTLSHDFASPSRSTP